MRKVPKSLQAIIITFIVGMFVPKIFDLTGIALVDKVLWKILLSLAFNVATIIVGILFSAKLLHGKVEGGKARISIFLLMVIILLCFSSSIIVFFKEVAKTVLIILASLAILAIALLIINYIISIKEKKSNFKETQTRSIDLSKPNASNVKKNTHNGISSTQENIRKTQTTTSEQPKPILERKMKTVYELWQEFDQQKKCLTITNNENPDLRWVKIYKPPYGNGKFYGYIMMQNAKNTVNGEIYFADRPIWSLYAD